MLPPSILQVQVTHVWSCPHPIQPLQVVELPTPNSTTAGSGAAHTQFNRCR